MAITVSFPTKEKREHDKYKKMMVDSMLIGLQALGATFPMAHHIVMEHFLPLTTFGDEFKDELNFSKEELEEFAKIGESIADFLEDEDDNEDLGNEYN